jgi:SH3-like domain-containing protein
MNIIRNAIRNIQCRRLEPGKSQRSDFRFQIRILGYVLVFIFITQIAFAARMTVRVSMANVRSGPGSQYKILWKLEKNHPIDMVKRSGEWCLFSDFEGDRGWIQFNLLDSSASVIIIKDQCKVRSGPGEKYSVEFITQRGVPFEVIEKRKDWVHIRHADGEAGWIHQSLVW